MDVQLAAEITVQEQTTKTVLLPCPGKAWTLKSLRFFVHINLRAIVDSFIFVLSITRLNEKKNQPETLYAKFLG